LINFIPIYKRRDRQT